MKKNRLVIFLILVHNIKALRNNNFFAVIVLVYLLRCVDDRQHRSGAWAATVGRGRQLRDAHHGALRRGPVRQLLLSPIRALL